MEPHDILKQINDIFKDVLDNDKVSVTETTTANDIEEWDSLTHIQLVVAIEKHFKVRFTTQEIQQWKNVGDMCASVKNRVNA